MAEAKKSFPMLPVAHWFALRRKFKQSIPGVVTNNYLSTVLDMGADSARANVLPFLKVLGIIDEEGKPKDRAKQWRDDGHYPDVCKAILKEVYPPDLLDAVPNPATTVKWQSDGLAITPGQGKLLAGVWRHSILSLRMPIPILKWKGPKGSETNDISEPKSLLPQWLRWVGDERRIRSIVGQ